MGQMVGSNSTNGDRGMNRWAVAALTTVAAVLALAAPAATEARGAVRTAALDYGKAERVKTLPITSRPWQETRSVMSLPPQRVGELISGDKIEAGGEAEFTICLKPNPRHPGSGQPCVGEMYGYNPTIKAKLVLAQSESSTADVQTKPLSKTKSLTCRQDHPVRNHHCVVSIPFSSIRIPDAESLPCEGGRCHINMIVSAHHPGAGSNEKVVVGSSDDNKRIHQGLAQLSSLRHRPGARSKPSKTFRGGRSRKKLRVVSKDSKIKRQVIYSAKVSRLKRGDQLVVDAQAQTKIGHLPYNVFHRTEVVLAKNRRSTKPFGKVLEGTARISASNGLNCTKGKSAHSSPCKILKTGVMSVKKKAKGPFYVNVVAGAHAIGTTPQVRKWRKSHRAKVSKGGGYVRVHRYKGSSACKTCSTGKTKWGPNNKPSSGKPKQLVKQLGRFGIDRGTYDCGNRSDGSYVCNWTSEGRFGDGPRYRCDSKAFYRKKSGRFDIKVCKDQLASQLWHFLVNRPGDPVDPTFTGVCNEVDKGYRCKWFGDKASGPKAGRGCKGFGLYRLPEHSWAIDTCKV